MESIWKKTAELPEFHTLTKDIRTKVLIIGGGIRFAPPGFSVLQTKRHRIAKCGAFCMPYYNKLGFCRWAVRPSR